MVASNPKEGENASYSAKPRRRRGNRRATWGSAFTGAEPKLAGLTPTGAQAGEGISTDGRDAWLKEQRPPHYQNRV